jgi:hypothetical protein
MYGKNELRSVISGVGDHAATNLICAAAHHLREGQEASRIAQKPGLSKEEETEKLIEWININNLWISNHDETRFIASGAEQRVYLHEDGFSVYKLNDSIFYQYWVDYFHSLLIHNYFFPATAYLLIGFYHAEETLYAVVKQPFIEITELTNVESVKAFLAQNGFQLKKNNDYFSSELGLILEDLHEENVLSNNGILFFIDTVFYLENSFYKD